MTIPKDGLNPWELTAGRNDVGDGYHEFELTFTGEIEQGISGFWIRHYILTTSDQYDHVYINECSFGCFGPSPEGGMSGMWLGSTSHNPEDLPDYGGSNFSTSSVGRIRGREALKFLLNDLRTIDARSKRPPSVDPSP